VVDRLVVLANAPEVHRRFGDGRSLLMTTPSMRAHGWSLMSVPDSSCLLLTSA
jgi:hypothetical protein